MYNLIPNHRLLHTHSPLDVVNVMNNVTKNCYKAPAVQKAFFEVRHDAPRPSHPTPSHPILSRPAAPYLIPPYLIPPYLIPPYLIPLHPISSHRTLSHPTLLVYK
jgi:hypothetical protein